MGSHCSLIDQFPPSVKGRAARAQFLEQSAGCLIATEETQRWPGGGTIKGTTSLWKFRLEPTLRDLLLARAKGLYRLLSPRLPEDLAVYREDGSVLLGSVAHEHMAWMNLTDHERADPRLGLVDFGPATR